MNTPTVERRAFPYPYQAMLALCSDLDRTRDWQQYWDIIRFLNTDVETPMGPGVDLEVGNSIYFDQTPGRFSYWNADLQARHLLRMLIRSGHVDCLHSFGALARTRQAVQRSLDDLERHHCRLEVWTDHSRSATNFGDMLANGGGDRPGHPAYHADLTLAHGVQYVLRGRATSVVGQDAPPSLAGIWTPRHALVSARTLAKEAAKRALGRLGVARFALHADNALMRPVRLRDGGRVYEFVRCNPHWGGVGAAADPAGLAEILTDRMLDRLVRRQGASVVYTHLAAVVEPSEVAFAPATVAALRRLARAHHDGRVLVTTTRRLLGYARARRELRWTAQACGLRRIRIDVQTSAGEPVIQAPLARSDLDGLTFYVPDGTDVLLFIDGRPQEDVRLNEPDQSGRVSASLPWPKLPLPIPAMHGVRQSERTS